ncbi:MAG: hypothetical protein WC823_05050 [Parcubacteria group bacterium]|jgi:hypothetical protein
MNNNNNCIHQNELGNFCGQCGVVLKERCLECGEMEKIGRVMCETRLRLAEQERHIFMRRCDCYLPMILIIITTIGTLWVGWSLDTSYIWWSIIKVVLVIGICVLANNFLNRISEKQERKFLQQNPHLAEILKQAEEKNEKRK